MKCTCCSGWLWLGIHSQLPRSNVHIQNSTSGDRIHGDWLGENVLLVVNTILSILISFHFIKITPFLVIKMEKWGAAPARSILRNPQQTTLIHSKSELSLIKSLGTRSCSWWKFITPSQYPLDIVDTYHAAWIWSSINKGVRIPFQDIEWMLAWLFGLGTA